MLKYSLRIQMITGSEPIVSLEEDPMKIIVIGATGTVGSGVVTVLKGRGHEVVEASRKGPEAVDLTDPGSLRALFERVGAVAGFADYGPVGQFGQHAAEPLASRWLVVDDQDADGFRGRGLVVHGGAALSAGPQAAVTNGRDPAGRDP